MPVPTSIADLSTTAASNYPAGSDAIGTSLDDYLRTVQAIIKRESSKGSDITAATTIDVPNDGSYFVVTGNTTIAGISDDWVGRTVVLKFSGTPQLTHSASFILPGSANITAAAGDTMLVSNESTGVWRCVAYQKASGASVVAPSGSITASGYTQTTARILGRTTASTGAVEELTVSEGIQMGSGTVKADVNGLTEDTTPDTSADFALVYDASASNHKKVKLNKIGNSITLGTLVNTTSGTNADFTGIPAGVKQITVNFNGVSTNGTSNFLVQLGDSGGIENTGYTSAASRSSSYTNSTAGFVLTQTGDASVTHSGSVTISLQDSASNTWCSMGIIMRTSDFNIHHSAGAKALSAVLDRVRVTTVSGDTFDAGSINISYE